MAGRYALAGILLGLAFFQTSCYEKQEGCLDIQATNFDFGADIPCSDCCTYPELSIKPEHRIVLADTILIFRYDSLYATQTHPNDSFRVHRLRYYLSGFRLLGAGEAGQVTDTITLFLPQSPGDTSSVSAIDDFMLADRGFVQTAVLGTWSGSGLFDQLEFTLGIDESFRWADPAKMPSGHPLAAPEGGYNWEEGTGYISNYMEYSLANQPEDTLRVAITTPVSVSVTLNPPLEIPPGYDLQLNLFFNYLAWWEGVNLSTATPSEIEQNYANQAGGSLFSIEAVLK